MIDILERARYEIITLRKTNEILSAQIQVVEIFALALGMKQQTRGETIDVAWELQREIDKLKS